MGHCWSLINRTFSGCSWLSSAFRTSSPKAWCWGWWRWWLVVKLSVWKEEVRSNINHGPNNFIRATNLDAYNWEKGWLNLKMKQVPHFLWGYSKSSTRKQKNGGRRLQNLRKLARDLNSHKLFCGQKENSMSLFSFELTVHAVLLLLQENSSNHCIMQMYLLSLDLLLSTLLLPPRVCCTLYHDESVETYALCLSRSKRSRTHAVQLV